MAFFALIMLIWSKDVLLTYVRAAIMRIPYIGNYPDLFLVAIWSICILFAIPEIIKRLRVNNILFVLIVASVYLLNYIIFPDNKDALDSMLNGFMFTLLPMYLIGATIDVKRYFPYMYILSVLSVIAMTVYKTLINDPMTDIVSKYAGDMDAAYKILPHICMVIYGMINKPNLANIATFLVGFVLLFSLGCRGAFGCMLAFFIIMLLWFKKYKHPALTYTVFLTAGSLIIVFFYRIVDILGQIAANLGLSIRIFEKITSGEIFASSSRDTILEQVWSKIVESPMLGNGIGADRNIILNGYAHNIIYEFWLNFGIPLGSILLITVILMIFRAYFATKTNNEKVFLVIMVFCGFVHLFMSGSYLTSANFFLLLGLCSKFISENKKQPYRIRYSNTNKETNK